MPRVATGKSKRKRKSPLKRSVKPRESKKPPKKHKDAPLGSVRKGRPTGVWLARELNAGRTPRARTMDSKKTAKKTLRSFTEKNVKKWSENPDRIDMRLVDTQGQKGGAGLMTATRTKGELYKQAQSLGISGRSKMNKAQLEKAVKKARRKSQPLKRRAKKRAQERGRGKKNPYKPKKDRQTGVLEKQEKKKKKKKVK